MSKSQKLIIILLVMLVIFTFSVPAYSAVSDAAALFLKIVNEPGATAMGGCAINNIDAQSALYNPGAAGLFYLNKNFSFSLPNNTMWLKELTNDMRYKTFNIGGGVTLKQLNKSFHDKFNASLSLSYSRQKLTYGSIVVTDNSGTIVGEDHPFENANNYTIGLGLEFYARLGVGYTIKKIHSELSSVLIGSGIAKTTASDFGLIADLPLGQILPLELMIGENREHSINFDFTPSYAYVKANSGDDLEYRNESQSDPLPEVKKTGYSVYGGVNLDQSSILSFRIVRETEEDLVNEEAADIEKDGQEIGFFGVFYYRWGKYEDSFGRIDIKTSGYAINLKNIVKWFDTIGPGYENKTERFITDRFDFIFEYASYDGDDNQALANIAFIKICFSI